MTRTHETNGEYPELRSESASKRESAVGQRTAPDIAGGALTPSSRIAGISAVDVDGIVDGFRESAQSDEGSVPGRSAGRFDGTTSESLCATAVGELASKPERAVRELSAADAAAAVVGLRSIELDRLMQERGVIPG